MKGIDLKAKTRSMVLQSRICMTIMCLNAGMVCGVQTSVTKGTAVSFSLNGGV